MYTQLGVMTKGTVIEVNVSELGMVTTGGKVVFGKYAQITNNPENDGCINAVLRESTLKFMLSQLLKILQWSDSLSCLRVTMYHFSCTIVLCHVTATNKLSNGMGKNEEETRLPHCFVSFHVA